MTKTTFLMKPLMGAAFLLLTANASAALIAQYTFDDATGTNIANPGTYDLVSVNSPSLTGGSFQSGNTGYMEVEGPGGMPNFTVSLWAYTDKADQGDFKALFSNNTSATADFSWQIDSTGGVYTLRSAVAPAVLSIGAVSTGVWQHIVLQKVGGAGARVFLDGTLVGSLGSNPGGLQNFRVGINRNSNQSFDGFIDNIQIYDDRDVSARTLFAQGPGLNAVTSVPEPASLALLGLGLLGLGAMRRRAS